MMNLRAKVLAAVFAMPPVTSFAVTLPDMTGPVILTVTGLDPSKYDGGRVEFDITRLESLGKTEFSTSSIWTQDVHRYSGIMLRSLIDALQIDATTLNLHALNDYAIDFPVAEATEDAPLLAFESDGEPMSVRDKGPIWVIYPYDSSADYRTDTIYTRSIWQLDRIDVLP